MQIHFDEIGSRTFAMDIYEKWRMEQAARRILHFWWPVSCALLGLGALQVIVGRLPVITFIRGYSLIFGLAGGVWVFRGYVLCNPVACAFIQVLLFFGGCAFSVLGSMRIEGQLYVHRFFLTSCIPTLFCCAALGYLPTKIFQVTICPVFFLSWVLFHIMFDACDIASVSFGIVLVLLATMVQALINTGELKRFEAQRKLEDEQQYLDATQACLSELLSSQFLATCICNRNGSILCSTPQLDNLLNLSGTCSHHVNLGSFTASPDHLRRLHSFLPKVLLSSSSRTQTIHVSLNVGRVINSTLYALLLPSRKGTATEQGIFIGLQEAAEPTAVAPPEETLPEVALSDKKEVLVRRRRSSEQYDGACSSKQIEVASAKESHVRPPGLYERRHSELSLARPSRLQARKPLKLEIDCSQVKEDTTHSITHGAWDHYTDVEQLGRGSIGRVFRARQKVDGKIVVLKAVDCGDNLRLAEDEFKLLQSLKHPNIIRAFDFFTSKHYGVIVLEYVNGATLDVAVKQDPKNMLMEVVVCPLFKSLLLAVCYLHERRIVHRDIKPTNVMVSHTLKDLRLLDFNTAKRLTESGALTITGTILYAGPEVLQGEPPAESNDVWACGLCLHLMLFGSMPWPSHFSPPKLAIYIVAHPLDLCNRPQPISDSCREVLRQCLVVDKRFRPAPITLLMYSWFWSLQSPELAKPPMRGRFGNCRLRTV